MSDGNEEFIRKTDADKVTATLRDLAKDKALGAARSMGQAEAYDHSASLFEGMLTSSAVRPQEPQAPSAPKVITAKRATPPRGGQSKRSRANAVKMHALDIIRGREDFTHLDMIMTELAQAGIEADRTNVKYALEKEAKAGRLDKRGSDSYRVVPLGEVRK